MISVVTILFAVNTVFAAANQPERHPQFVLSIRDDDDFETIKKRLEGIVNSPKFYYQGLLPYRVPSSPEYASSLYDKDAAGPVDIYRQVSGERNWLIYGPISIIKAHYSDKFKVVWLDARNK